jgi:AraC-like DNA-binding protein
MTPDERHSLLVRRRRTKVNLGPRPGPHHAGRQTIRVACHKAAIRRQLPKLKYLLTLSHLSVSEAAEVVGFRHRNQLNAFLRRYTGAGTWPATERISEAIERLESIL